MVHTAACSDRYNIQNALQCKPKVIPLAELSVNIQTYLVNGAWNETVNVFVGSKDLGESCAEGWGRLDSREGHLTNVITVTESKDPLGLVHRHTLLDL